MTKLFSSNCFVFWNVFIYLFFQARSLKAKSFTITKHVGLYIKTVPLTYWKESTIEVMMPVTSRTTQRAQSRPVHEVKSTCPNTHIRKTLVIQSKWSDRQLREIKVLNIMLLMHLSSNILMIRFIWIYHCMKFYKNIKSRESLYKY